MNSTYLIVGGFLVITLLMGIYAGRGIKSIDDYIRGGRSYCSFSLALTFIATIVGGGSVIGAVYDTFNIGLVGRIPVLASIFQLLIFAFLLAPRIAMFGRSLTTGDIMNELYGVKAKVLTGILGSLFTLCITAMQLSALGKLMQHVLGVDFTIGVVGAELVSRIVDLPH